jgi:glutamine synthetase
MTTPADVLKIIAEKEVKWIDFRFCDTRGKEQHVSVPSHTVKESLFTEGKMFDGSSIAGWKGINESDMILLPDASSAVLDPFFDETTLNLRLGATVAGRGGLPRAVTSAGSTIGV